MRTRSVVAIVSVLFSMPSMAQDIGSELFAIRLGGFSSKVDTKVSANASSGAVGTTVDFESDLALKDKSTSPFVNATWRFSPAHRLALDYYKLDRSGTTSLRGTINWGDQVYPVNSTVNGFFKSDVIALTYLYSLAQDRDSELSAGIGLHNTKFSAGIASSLGTLSVSKSANAPLPVLALQGTARFLDNWRVEGSVKWLGLKIGDYDGRLSVFQLAVQYFPIKNWGIEGGYAANDYRLVVGKPAWQGSTRYKFNGPTVALVGQF